MQLVPNSTFSQIRPRPQWFHIEKVHYHLVDSETRYHPGIRLSRQCTLEAKGGILPEVVASRLEK
jgi:hypothetical protein